MINRKIKKHVTKKELNKFLDVRNFIKFDAENKNLPSSSWLFVTRNRCPNVDPEKNPLVWAFQTLINNKYYQIDDFVVVDDHSDDYTKSCIDWIRRRYNININYIKSKERLSCSESRRVGLTYTKNNLVFMGDDDCLYSEHFLIGSVLTYIMLLQQKPKEKISVINLPVYEKRFWPEFTIPKEKIGKVIINQTFFYHEFDCFPLEYIQSPRYLDVEKLILRPLKVETFKGVNLCDKSLILKAGNYLDLSMWPSSYSEHIELSYRLGKMGFSIYHQSDPRISCLHLKYGAVSSDKFDKRLYHKKILGLKYSIGQMVDWAKIRNADTGARLSDDLFHTDEIGSFFSFYLKISDKLGLKFAKNQYELFVEEGIIFSTTPSGEIKNRETRKTIFFKGIKRGMKATEIQTGKNYQNIYQQVVEKLFDK